jgi:signal transduction histidine kinase
MRITDFYDDEMKMIVEKTMKQGIKKNIGGFETNVNRKDGTKVPFLFISKPIIYEGKNCVIGIGMDVSKQKKIEEELIKSYTQIRQLTEHLQIVREEERAYLAREVHDVLGQQLTVLKMDMAWLKSKLASKDTEFKERMTGMDDMMDETIKTVRQISSDLRSGVLDNFGFAAAIEWQSMEFRKKTGIIVNFFDETDGLKIPQKHSMGLFRIFQECLTNIARHAMATKVDISLRRSGGELLLQIKDNGKGFNTKKVMEKKTLGLIGMQERTKIIHGNINIHSKPGNGTTIDLSIPEKELTEH